MTMNEEAKTKTAPAKKSRKWIVVLAGSVALVVLIALAVTRFNAQNYQPPASPKAATEECLESNDEFEELYDCVSTTLSSYLNLAYDHLDHLVENGNYRAASEYLNTLFLGKDGNQTTASLLEDGLRNAGDSASDCFKEGTNSFFDDMQGNLIVVVFIVYLIDAKVSDSDVNIVEMAKTTYGEVVQVYYETEKTIEFNIAGSITSIPEKMSECVSFDLALWSAELVDWIP